MLADPDYSSRTFLTMIEQQGLTGTWRWTFATGEQVWSPGLFRLLGLEPGAARPSYNRLLACLHPEDQTLPESAEEVRAGCLSAHTVRIIRPDGGLRTVTSRGEIRVAPDGRPESAAGVLLDVTDRGDLVQAQRTERRRRRALFEQTQSWTHAALYVKGRRTPSDELLTLTGLSRAAFQADCEQVVLPEDRGRMSAHIRAMMAAGRPFEVDKRLVLAEGGFGHFRFVYAPVRDAQDRIETWATLAYRVGGVRAAPLDRWVRLALESGITGAHMRAGRALLGWSMATFAEASGLSLSTIRRLEEDDPGALARSRPTAVAALRQAGIGFQICDGNRIALSRL